jgi:hypothetical protein
VLLRNLRRPSPAHVGAALIVRFILIIATLALGCGTLQPSISPEQEVLSSGFPSKPWPNQVRTESAAACHRFKVPSREPTSRIQPAVAQEQILS